MLFTSYFRNWRKHDYNSKSKELSRLWPVKVNKIPKDGMEIEFSNDTGERITFYLCKEHKENLIQQLNKFT